MENAIDILESRYYTILERTFHPLYERIIESLHLTGEQFVLDIGCGSGGFLSLASKSKCKITGIDFSEKLINIARKKNPNGNFEIGKMEQLPFIKNSFDVIVAINSFQYSVDIDKTMASVFDILKPGGELIISLWCRPQECESFNYLKIFNLMTDQRDDFSGPFKLSEDGEIEKLLTKFHYKIGNRIAVSCPRIYPDLKTALEGILSTNFAKQAINYSTYESIKEKVIKEIEPFLDVYGSYRINNNFFFINAVK